MNPFANEGQPIIILFRIGFRMFDKLLGKKEKGIKIFNLPEKKYCTDGKKIAKMDKKDLLELSEDMEKHIKILIEKLEGGKKQYEGALQKIDEVSEKHLILNGEMCRINNEHEELSVKFTNLQSSLEVLTQEKEEWMEKEVSFLQDKGLLPREKVKTLQRVFDIYHDQVSLGEKISNQNKQLKQKVSELQNEYFELSDKFNEQKKLMPTADIETLPNESSKSDENENESDEEKVAYYKSIIEGKQQIQISLQKKIDAERAKNCQLREEIARLHHEVKGLIESIGQSEEQCDLLKTKTSELGEKLKVSSQKMKELEDEMEKQQMEKEKYQQMVSQKNLQIQQISKQLEQAIEAQQMLGNDKDSILESNRIKISDTSNALCEALNKLEESKKTIDEKGSEISRLKQKIQSLEGAMSNLHKLSSGISSKQKQAEELESKIKSLSEENETLKKKFVKAEQQFTIRSRKMEFELNQERIKIESMKRTLSQLEAKDEESQNKLDEMYEFKVRQEGKMVHMEKKLKEYKHLIQYLKKQKVQMEKTFENKLKNFEEMVVAEPEDEEEDQSEGKESDVRKMSSQIDGLEYEAQITIMNNRMVDMEETLDIMKMEGRQLANKNNELEMENASLKKSIKILNEKREEAMKEINKLSSSRPITVTKKTNPEDAQGRDKKIAEKAFRGFDIISKNLHPLYKKFLGIHMADIQKPEVKEVETGINMLLKKSMDMKDIFQDYL